MLIIFQFFNRFCDFFFIHIFIFVLIRLQKLLFPIVLNAARLRRGQLTLSDHVAFTTEGEGTVYISPGLCEQIKHFCRFCFGRVCPVQTSNMTWTNYQLFLAGLMLTTGSINTLSAKWVISFFNWCHVFMLLHCRTTVLQVYLNDFNTVWMIFYQNL